MFSSMKKGGRRKSSGERNYSEIKKCINGASTEGLKIKFMGSLESITDKEENGNKKRNKDNSGGLTFEQRES